MKKTPILVIDNDPEITGRIEDILKSEGYLVLISPTESLAITTAKEIEPSLIFVSLSMPGGLEICKNIHSIREFSKTPIIALTTQEKGPKIRYGVEYGIIDTLDKSFSPEELTLKVETVLSIKGITETSERGIDDIPEYESAIESEIIGTPAENFEEESSVFSISREIPKSVPPYEEVGNLIEKSFEPRRINPVEKNRKIVLEMRRSNLPLILGVGAILIISAAGFLFWQGGGFDFGTIFKNIKQKLPVKATTQVQKKEPLPEPQAPAKPRAQETPPIEMPKVILEPPPKEPVKKTTDKKRPFYSVQVGAFKNRDNAESLAKGLQGKGYDAFVYSITIRNEKIHKVLVGKLEDRKKTEELASTLKTKENIKTLIFSGSIPNSVME